MSRNSPQTAVPDAAGTEPARAVEGMMVLEPGVFRVLFVNDRMLELLEAPRERVEGRTWAEMAADGLKFAGHPIFAEIPPDGLLQGDIRTELLPAPSGSDA